ncbi:MAG: dual specificity protein phosphatase family protein [Azoarcus sp.]|jgi:protein-tyrosine phosphatase|nr:dual specificity protein phosphatase family protein [Azoarcus sp.]
MSEVHWIRGAFRRGLIWLVFLGPFFFLSYGSANHYAAARDGVTSFYFVWERGIPLWPWTIIPYWSIDLLYGFAFLCCHDKAETNRLGLRLLSAQLIAVTCFFLWPLHFAFERPAVDGLTGALFSVLTQFDRPYNQAPSLHITLLVIVWRQFSMLEAPSAVRALIHTWAFLIGISVLTTWQHHFIDVPTGLALGLLCLWLWPDTGKTPLRKTNHAKRPALAACYFLGALLVLALALAMGGIWLALGWPALSLALVAFNYAWAGSAGFQKHDGRHSLAARWLFAPYMLGAWINSRLWTRHRPFPDLVANGVWLGRLPTAREFAAWARMRDDETALFDLTAELPAPALPASAYYDGLPCLDLAPVPAQTLLDAAHRIEALRGQNRDVWVACALGYSRSAAAMAAWLHHAEKAASIREAVTLLRQARPQVTLDTDNLARLDEFAHLATQDAH